MKPKKAARASLARAKSEADGTTQSFVACYSIVLAGARECERLARVCLSREELREWLASKEAIWPPATATGQLVAGSSKGGISC
jgi:hypothetical protein